MSERRRHCGAGAALMDADDSRSSGGGGEAVMYFNAATAGAMTLRPALQCLT